MKRKITLKRYDYVVISILVCFILFSAARLSIANSVQGAKITINSVFVPRENNPNIESVELYIEESGNLCNYTLTDGELISIQLPPVEVNKGHYVRVFTGVGEPNAKKIYMKIDERIWKEEGVIQLYYKDVFVEEYEY